MKRYKRLLAIILTLILVLCIPAYASAGTGAEGSDDVTVTADDGTVSGEPGTPAYGDGTESGGGNGGTGSDDGTANAGDAENGDTGSGIDGENENSGEPEDPLAADGDQEDAGAENEASEGNGTETDGEDPETENGPEAGSEAVPEGISDETPNDDEVPGIVIDEGPLEDAEPEETEFVNTVSGTAKPLDGPIADGTYVFRSAVDTDYVLDVQNGSYDSGANIQVWKYNGSLAQEFEVMNAGDGYYHIYNAGSGFVLDVEGGQCVDGTNIRQYDWNGTKAQLWKPVVNDDGSYTFTSALSEDHALDLYSASAKNGSNISLYKRNGTLAQNWFLSEPMATTEAETESVEYAHMKTGTYLIRTSIDSTRVIEIAGGSRKNNANVQLNKYNKASAQLFKIRKFSGGYKIININSGKALQVSEKTAKNGQNIIQRKRASTKAQLWKFIKNSDGTYTIVSALNSKYVLDLAGARTEKGSNIQLYKKNNTKAQKWEIKKATYTPAVYARYLYCNEVEKASYKYLGTTAFVTIQKLKRGTSRYILTHVVINKPSQIKGGLSNHSYGGEREKATHASKRLNWLVGTNASNFSYSTGRPVYAGLVIKKGKLMEGSVTNGMEICLKKDGTLYSPLRGLMGADLILQGVTDTFSCGDTLLISGGKAVNEGIQSEQYRYPRTAVGMVKPGDYYLLHSTGNDYDHGLTYDDVREILMNKKCVFGKCMDGGGSCSLVYNNKLINETCTGVERAVVDFLYFIK